MTDGSAGRKDLTLISVSVNGKAVSEADYERTDKKLTINNLPQGKFDLEIVVDIKPQVKVQSLLQTLVLALVHSRILLLSVSHTLQTCCCCLTFLLRR